MKRRTHTDATKKRLVAKAFRLENILQVASEAKIAHSVLRNWCKDKRYGGKPSAFSNKTQAAAIPQEKLVVSHKKPRELVATQFNCPWCGGPIKTGE